MEEGTELLNDGRLKKGESQTWLGQPTWVTWQLGEVAGLCTCQFSFSCQGQKPKETNLNSKREDLLAHIAEKSKP